jgi:hypothetical protein
MHDVSFEREWVGYGDYEDDGIYINREGDGIVYSLFYF